MGEQQEKRDLQRFAKHSTIYAIGSMINRLGAFLLLPIYTNYLTPYEYGALELFYLISAIVSSLLGVGIAHATLRFYFDFDKGQDRNSVISTNLIASLTISITGVAVILISWPWVSQEFPTLTEFGYAYQITMITLVLELGSQVCLAYLRAIERSLLFVGIACAKLVCQVSVNAYLVIVLSAGVEGVLFGNCLTVGLAFIFLMAFTFRHCGIHFELAKLKPVLVYSIPFMISTLIAVVTNYVDRTLVVYYIGLDQFGVFALALKFALLLEALIGEPFNRSYGAFRFTVMGTSQAAILQRDIIRYLLCALVIAYAGLILFVEPLLLLIAKPEYLVAVQYLPLVCFAACLRVLVYPLQTGILYEKKTNHILMINILVSIVGVASAFLLVPRLGVMGAGWSQIIVASMACWLTHYYSNRYFKVEYQIMRNGLAVLWGLALVLVIQLVPKLDFWPSLLFRIGLLAFLIYGIWRGGVLLKSERSWLNHWFQKRFAKA